MAKHSIHRKSMTCHTTMRPRWRKKQCHSFPFGFFMTAFIQTRGALMLGESDSFFVAMKNACYFFSLFAFLPGIRLNSSHRCESWSRNRINWIVIPCKKKAKVS